MKKKPDTSFEDEIHDNIIKDIEKEFGITNNQNTDSTEVEIKPDKKAKKKEKRKKNRELTIVTYSFLIVFVLLIGYLVKFIMNDNSEMLSNPYNRTQDLFAERVERGSILSADGDILAETVINSKGEEKRSYPYDNLFAHAVGHFDNGKTGIEAALNIYMLTSNTNPIVAAIDELRGVKSPGDDVVTTLDVDIQKVAYNALGSHKGAVIAMDPDTGAIVSMVSKPDYNPNTISSNWEYLTDDSDNNSALLNRATQGLYPPGSTFKVVTLLQYMRENGSYKDFSYKCNGNTSIDTVTINCYNKKKHGTLDLKNAFAKSCNSAFANIGSELNINQYNELCESLLFNKKLPYSYEYKESSFVLNDDSDTSEVLQTAIGQGKTMISPLHNAIIVSMVANGGYIVSPYLVDHVQNVNGNVVKKFIHKKGTQVINENEAKFIKKCMKETVKSGTAGMLSGQSYTAYGKTGSAEFDSSKASHAWFIGYAEKKGKKLAVSIIVEGAGTGSDYAVPIAKKIFDAYY